MGCPHMPSPWVLLGLALLQAGCVTAAVITQDNMIFEDAFEIRNSPDVERDGLFVLYYANNKGNRPIYLVELTGNSSEMNDGTVVSTASQLWRNRKRTEDIGELLDARRQARIQRESIATATGTFEKSQVIVIDYATDPPSVSADDRFVLVPWIVKPDDRSACAPLCDALATRSFRTTDRRCFHPLLADPC